MKDSSSCPETHQGLDSFLIYVEKGFLFDEVECADDFDAEVVQGTYA